MITSSRLLASINLKGALPEGRFRDDELLDLAYDCIIGDLQPLIIEVREEYFVKGQSFPIEANRSHYPISMRAVAGKLREVKLDRTSRVVNIPQIGIEDVTRKTVGQPNSFYLQNNDVVLFPTPSATIDTLDLTYFLRASRPVLPSDVAVVSDVQGNVVTATIPASWSVAESFDVMNRRGELILMDAVASNVNPTDITFLDTTGVSVGDYVSLAGESVLIQLPEESIPLLSWLTVIEALNSMSDSTGLQNAINKADRLRDSLIKLLTARVLGEPRRFTPQI